MTIPNFIKVQEAIWNHRPVIAMAGNVLECTCDKQFPPHSYDGNYVLKSRDAWVTHLFEMMGVENVEQQ